MKELTYEEMKNISGGANPIVISGLVGAVITFIIGALEGYSNPKSCHN